MFKRLLTTVLTAALLMAPALDADAGKRRADQFQADELYLCKEQGADPATPGTGTAGLYCKTDGRWYLIDDAGSVLKVGDASLIEDADGDTGIETERTVDDDVLWFKVFGSDKGFWNATGLHLGGTSPTTLFGIKGNGNQLFIEQSNTPHGWKFNVDDANGNLRLERIDAGTTEYFTIEAGGEVGIGVTNPNSKLRVAGDVAADKFKDTSNFAHFVDPGSASISAALNGPAIIGGTSPDASALLDMVSTTKGLGLPSQTTVERDAITTPRDGLMVYDETTDRASLRANGAWVNLSTTSQGGGMIPLGTVDGAATASINLTSLIDSTYKVYKIILVGVQPVTDNDTLWMRISTDNGATWKSGASDYGWSWYGAEDTGAISAHDGLDSEIELTRDVSGGGVGNDATYSLNAEITLFHPSDTALEARFQWLLSHRNANNQFTRFSHTLGQYNTTTAVDAIQLLWRSGGNFNAGTAMVYGLKTP